jgi:hypothetical protein
MQEPTTAMGMRYTVLHGELLAIQSTSRLPRNLVPVSSRTTAGTVKEICGSEAREASVVFNQDP